MKAITCEGVCELPFQVALLCLSAALELVVVPCCLLRDVLNLLVTRVLSPLERNCKYLRRRVEARIDVNQIAADF